MPASPGLAPERAVALVAAAQAIAAACARGDGERAAQLAATLPAPADALVDAGALARALADALRADGQRVPPGVDELARPGRHTLAMSELARELADPDLFATRVPGWLPAFGVVFVISAMALAVWVGRHSLGFIDPPPDCEVPATATSVAAVRFDVACHVLSWQTDAGATWIVARGSGGEPRLATRSAKGSIRVLELDDVGDWISARGTIAEGELTVLRGELNVMIGR